jgi:hypothetical protein
MGSVIVPIVWKKKKVLSATDVIKSLIQIVIAMVLEKSISFLMEAFLEEK